MLLLFFKEGPLGSWTWSSLQRDIGQAGVKAAPRAHLAKLIGNSC